MHVHHTQNFLNTFKMHRS